MAVQLKVKKVKVKK